MPTQKYPSVIERYYTKYFHRKADAPDEAVCVLAHSNKVCVITLSPEHRALKEGAVQSIKYVVETCGRKVTDVSGKKKNQAILLTPGSPLCVITSGNGTKYVVKSPIKGKLCELNDNILKDVKLLQKMPQTNGYLAIVIHQTCSDEEFCKHLLTEERYLNGEVLHGDEGIDEDATARKRKGEVEVGDHPAKKTR